MTIHTITRNCLNCQNTRYEIVRITRSGNRIVRCQTCKRTEELTMTDHIVPGSVIPGKELAR